MASPKISIILPAYNAEPTLPRMLEAIKAQTFENFEVIIINDGSSDETQQVVDRYCEEDERFRSCKQDHKGVSAARNRGLDLAVGDYVLFYDADDDVPPKAVQKMYNRARQHMADLVIGQNTVHQMSDCYNETTPEFVYLRSEFFKCNPALQQVAYKYDPTAKEEIPRYDLSLCRSFRLCNKIFRRTVIEENKIRFNGTSFGAEAVFLFRFIFACKETISGCPDLVYEYYKKPGWTEEKLLQPTSTEDLNNLFSNFNEILQMADKYIDRELSAIDRSEETEGYKDEMRFNWKRFRSMLTKQMVQILLLDNYYRFIWNRDDSLYPKMKELMDQCREKLLPSDWKSLMQENPDLHLDVGLMDKDEMADNPILTVIISTMLPSSEINRVLSAYYSQLFSAFEVIIDKDRKGDVDPIFLDKKNLRFLKHRDLAEWHYRALEVAKGSHCIIVDAPILPAERTILQMMEAEENLNCTFITAPMMRPAADGTYEELRAHSAAFVNEFDVVKLRSSYNQLDCIWGNKIFIIKNLLAKKRLFEGKPDKDLDRLYNNSSYVKFHDNAFMTSLTNADILKHVHKLSVRLGYGGKLRKEARRLRRLEKENKRTKTFSQRLRKWRNKKLRGCYKYLTLKILFPLYYKWNARKPVQENKVIFIVNRKDQLPNSMTYLNSLLEKSGKYDIHIHYLLKLSLRYREQFKVDMNLMKDMATAKYVFVDEATISLCGFTNRPETKVVQLWHGCGAFKKFGFSTADKIFGGNAKEQKRYPMYRNFDLVCVSSPEVIWAYEEAMQLEGQGNVKAVGVSRTDVFYQEDYKKAAVQRVIDKIPAAAEKKIILYAPTFRGRVAKAYGPDRFDYDKLYEALGDDYILLIKHHPLVKKLPEIPLEYKDSFVYDVSHTLEIEDLMIAADICISDYSSLIFEYSLMEKPIILFAYDLDTYFDWRGFYYDYFEMAPGPVLVSTEEIIDYIVHIDTEFDREKMHAFREKFMSSCDGHSTERILAEVGLKL